MASSQDTTSTATIMPSNDVKAATTPPKARKIIAAKSSAHRVASTSIQDARRLAPLSLRLPANAGFSTYELVVSGSSKRRVLADHPHEPAEAQLRGPKRHKLDVAFQRNDDGFALFKAKKQLEAKLLESEKSKAAGDAEIAELTKQAEADRQTATSQYDKLAEQNRQLLLELQAERARGEQAKQTSDADLAGFQTQLGSVRDAARSEISSRDATIQQLRNELTTARSLGDGAFTAKSNEVSDLKQQLETAGHMAARQKKEADAAITQLNQELDNMRSVGEEAFKAKNKEVANLQQELETASQKAALEKKGAEERINQLTGQLTAERSGREQAIQANETEISELKERLTNGARDSGAKITQLSKVSSEHWSDFVEARRQLDSERTGRAKDNEEAQKKFAKQQMHLEDLKMIEQRNTEDWMKEYTSAYAAVQDKDIAESRLKKSTEKLQETTNYLYLVVAELRQWQAEAQRLARNLKPTTGDVNNLAARFGQQM